MRLLLLLLILLAFPVLELIILFQLATRFGWWLLGYLLGAALVGWLLIQDERVAVFGRMATTLSTGEPPVRALLASAKKVIAGILLIFPGVLSDILAIVLLLMPAPRMRRPQSGQNTEDSVIEGEWRREE